MKVVRIDDAQKQKGDTFTGEVALQRVLGAQQEGGMTLSLVRFADGARTNWHVHPGEQILIVVEGEGRAGTATEEVQLRPGDVVYSGPNERHWHGAAPGKSMAHYSITNVGAPDWFEAPE